MEGAAIAGGELEAVRKVVAPRGRAGVVIAELVVVVMPRRKLHFILAEGALVLRIRARIAAGAVQITGVAGDVLLLIVRAHRQQLTAAERDVVLPGKLVAARIGVTGRRARVVIAEVRALVIGLRIVAALARIQRHLPDIQR